MTSLAQTLKQYFDIAIETDPALKEVYDEKKLDECGKYINNRARKLASNNMAMVESSVVFKWARDFFYGDMDDMIDLHVGASYRFDKVLTLWVKGNNLLNRKWDYMPGMGAQGS